MDQSTTSKRFIGREYCRFSQTSNSKNNGALGTLIIKSLCSFMTRSENSFSSLANDRSGRD